MHNPQRQLCLAFTLLLATMPIMAVAAPRGLAFLPGVVGFLFLLINVLAFKEKPALPKTALAGMAIISALCVVSACWAIVPGDAVSRALRTAVLLFSGCLLLSAAGTIRLDHLRPWLWIFPLSLCAAALLIVISQTGGDHLFRLVRGLPAGTYVYRAEYNRAGVFVILTLFPALSILRHYAGWPKIALLLAVSILPLLIVTNSQSIQLALLLGVMTIIAFPYRCKMAWVALAACIAALMLAAPFLAIWVFRTMAETIESIPMLGSGGGFAGTRLEIWDYVSRYMLQSPWHGFGIEATREIQNFDSKEIYQKGTTILHPHNFVIQTWIEFGVIGIVIAAGLLSALILRMQKYLSTNQARFALPTLIAVLSVGSTGYGMWQGWWIGTLFVSAAMCILAVRMNNEPEEKLYDR